MSIEIIDINDNAPAFGSAHVVFDIVEATQIGSVYIVQAATDADSPTYGVQKYELDSESGKFGLQISTKLDGSQEVGLYPFSSCLVIIIIIIHAIFIINCFICNS